MIEILFFPAYVFFAGFGICEFFNAFNTDDDFSIRICKCFGVGIALVALLSFSRTFTLAPFPLVFASIPLISLAFFAGSIAAKGKLTFWIKPAKRDFALLFLASLLGLFILAHFAKYPHFPEFASVDFSQYVNLVQVYSKGFIPPPLPQMLYFGVVYLLAVFGFFFSGNPLALVREGMAIFIVISIYFVYYASIKISKSGAVAVGTSLFYVFSGFLWFTMPFNSGIFANFYGGIVALFLIGVSIDFLKSRGYATLILAIVAALTSHYSTLFLFAVIPPALLLYGWKEKLFRRSVLAALMLLAPIALGAFVLNSLVSTLIGLLEPPPSASTLIETPFGKALGWPVLSAVFTEIGSDYLTIILLSFIPIFAAVCILKRQPLMLIPSLLIGLIFVVAPLNAGAWRFSFFALFPLTLIAGYVLGKGWELRFRRSGHPLFYLFAKQMAIIAILLLVLGTSWTGKALADSGTQTYELAAAQNADMKAMEWMQKNIPANEESLSVSDFQFTYAHLLVGRTARFDLSGFAAPEIASGLASQKDTPYVIVTNLVVGAQPFTCTYPFALSLSTNASEVRSGDNVAFRLSVKVFDPSNLKVENGTAAVYGNGAQLGTVTLYKGSSNFTAHLPQHGNYTFTAIIADQSTNPLTILSTSHPRPQWIQSPDSQTPTSCLPWFTFTWQRLGCHTPSCLVYADEFVKIWRVKGT